MYSKYSWGSFEALVTYSNKSKKSERAAKKKKNAKKKARIKRHRAKRKGTAFVSETALVSSLPGKTVKVKKSVVKTVAKVTTPVAVKKTVFKKGTAGFGGTINKGVVVSVATLTTAPKGTARAVQIEKNRRASATKKAQDTLTATIKAETTAAAKVKTATAKFKDSQVRASIAASDLADKVKQDKIATTLKRLGLDPSSRAALNAAGKPLTAAEITRAVLKDAAKSTKVPTVSSPKLSAVPTIPAFKPGFGKGLGKAVLSTAPKIPIPLLKGSSPGPLKAPMPTRGTPIIGPGSKSTPHLASISTPQTVLAQKVAAIKAGAQAKFDDKLALTLKAQGIKDTAVRRINEGVSAIQQAKSTGTFDSVTNEETGISVRQGAFIGQGLKGPEVQRRREVIASTTTSGLQRADILTIRENVAKTLNIPVDSLAPPMTNTQRAILAAELASLVVAGPEDVALIGATRFLIKPAITAIKPFARSGFDIAGTAAKPGLEVAGTFFKGSKGALRDVVGGTGRAIRDPIIDTGALVFKKTKDRGSVIKSGSSAALAKLDKLAEDLGSAPFVPPFRTTTQKLLRGGKGLLDEGIDVTIPIKSIGAGIKKGPFQSPGGSSLTPPTGLGKGTPPPPKGAPPRVKSTEPPRLNPKAEKDAVESLGSFATRTGKGPIEVPIPGKKNPLTAVGDKSKKLFNEIRSPKTRKPPKVDSPTRPKVPLVPPVLKKPFKVATFPFRKVGKGLNTPLGGSIVAGGIVGGASLLAGGIGFGILASQFGKTQTKTAPDTREQPQPTPAGPPGPRSPQQPQPAQPAQAAQPGQQTIPVTITEADGSTRVVDWPYLPPLEGKGTTLAPVFPSTLTEEEIIGGPIPGPGPGPGPVPVPVPGPDGIVEGAPGTGTDDDTGLGVGDAVAAAGAIAAAAFLGRSSSRTGGSPSFGGGSTSFVGPTIFRTGGSGAGLIIVKDGRGTIELQLNKIPIRKYTLVVNTKRLISNGDAIRQAGRNIAPPATDKVIRSVGQALLRPARIA